MTATGMRAGVSYGSGNTVSANAAYYHKLNPQLAMSLSGQFQGRHMEVRCDFPELVCAFHLQSFCLCTGYACKDDISPAERVRKP